MCIVRMVLVAPCRGTRTDKTAAGSADLDRFTKIGPEIPGGSVEVFLGLGALLSTTGAGKVAILLKSSFEAVSNAAAGPTFLSGKYVVP